MNAPTVEPQGPSAWLELLLTVLATLVLAVLIRMFVAETYQVPSGSMLDTIQLGDRLVGEKVSLHFRKPQVGDVVTFDDPNDPQKILIKRVIATEGQVIDLSDGVVVVDGEQLDEPYVQGKPSLPPRADDTSVTYDVSYPFTIPEGCIWVMGDNRTNSQDSRYFGPVPLELVSSRALFIYWPLSDAHGL